MYKNLYHWAAVLCCAIATFHVTTAKAAYEENVAEGFSYRITNANGRGDIYYCAAKSNSFVWSTGVANAPAADNDNCYRWVFIPTGEEDTYYIYNVGRQRFIEPLDLGTYHTLKGGKTWVFTPNKVPIKLTALGNNKFSIRTAETNHYLSVSNTFDGPVIDYYDATDPGVPFYFGEKTAINNTIRQQIEKASEGLMLSEVTVKQGFQTTGRGNKRTMLLRVGMMGFENTNIHPTRFAITIPTSTMPSIERVEVYQTNNPEFYADPNPRLMASVETPNQNSVDIDLADYQLTPGENFYWVTAAVKEDAELGKTIDAIIRLIIYNDNGTEKRLNVSSIGNPTGNARIFATQSFAFVPTTNNCKFYRIPAMILDKEGNIVVASDRRYNSNADLGGHKIDVSVRRSEDGGHTWTAQKLIAVGDGSTQANYGYGDAALARAADGRLICVMAAGSVMYWNGMRWAAFCTSDDNGITWTAPKQLYTSNFTDLVNNKQNQLGFYGNFVSSGKGLTTFDGTVMFTTNCLTNEDHGTPQCYILATKDGGESWTLGPENAYPGCDESKLEQLNDGRLIVSVRQSGNRGFNYGQSDATGWGTKWRSSAISGNACNADILVHSRKNTDGANVMLHTYCKSGARQNLTLSRSLDEGRTWTDLMNIQPGGAAYSTMVKLPNGDVAILFEDESYATGNGYALTFVVVANEQIMQDVPVGIENMVMPAHAQGRSEVYSIDGRRLQAPQHGLNIIKAADGTCKKVVIK